MAYFQVYGAGLGRANGVYVTGGFANGRAFYVDEGPQYLIFVGDGFWSISDTRVDFPVDRQYINHSRSLLPPRTGWTLGPRGVAPAPFVVPVCGKFG